MRNNKSYNYTDEFSDIVHTARFVWAVLFCTKVDNPIDENS